MTFLFEIEAAARQRRQAAAQLEQQAKQQRREQQQQQAEQQRREQQQQQAKQQRREQQQQQAEQQRREQQQQQEEQQRRDAIAEAAAKQRQKRFNFVPGHGWMVYVKHLKPDAQRAILSHTTAADSTRAFNEYLNAHLDHVEPKEELQKILDESDQHKKYKIFCNYWRRATGEEATKPPTKKGKQKMNLKSDQVHKDRSTNFMNSKTVDPKLVVQNKSAAKSVAKRQGLVDKKRKQGQGQQLEQQMTEAQKVLPNVNSFDQMQPPQQQQQDGFEQKLDGTIQELSGSHAAVSNEVANNGGSSLSQAAAAAGSPATGSAAHNTRSANRGKAP